MATLVAKVRNLTGSSTSDANVIEFLKDATAYVISHVPKELLHPYAEENSGVTDGSGFTYGNNTVLSVRRGHYASKLVDNKEAGFLEAGSGSLRLPTETFPKHYMRNGKVYIKPNPTAGSKGYINYIADQTIDVTTLTVLGNLEDVIVKRAAGDDFKYLGATNIASALTEISTANTILDKITSGTDPGIFGDEATYTTSVSQLTRAKAALDNAEDVINSNQPSATTDAFGAQANEDVELVTSALNIANTELQRAQAHMSEWSAQASVAVQQAQGYIANAQGYTANYQSYFAEGDKMYALSERSIQTLINNSSEMIALRVQAGGGE